MDAASLLRQEPAVAVSAAGVPSSAPLTGHEPKFNVYLYDGEHKEEDHYKAFTHFAHALDDVFIALVDDWNWQEVRNGTRRAFADLGFDVLWEKEVLTPTNFDGDWWNGSYLAIVAKPGATSQL